MSQYINVIEANLGEKIMLIKVVRRLYNLGLKESKELVETVSDAIVAVYGNDSVSLDVYMMYLDYAYKLQYQEGATEALNKITEPFRYGTTTNVYREIFITWLQTWRTKNG